MKPKPKHGPPGILYAFISPGGRKFEGRNIKYFAECHGLDYSHMHRLHYGKAKSHKGWTKFEA